MNGSTLTPTHPRDISEADLARALDAAPRPDLLRQLVDISREVFEFYVAQYSYTLTYPWAAAHLEQLPPCSRVLDIGAGVSPIPIFLARRGQVVDCIDDNPHTRTLPATDDWNEWGFFDYSILHKDLRSHHTNVIAFVPQAEFDMIYSLCALAHMKRAIREKTLQLCGKWLRPGGRLLLALDVIPSSDFLWNRSDGLEVEPPIEHGTIDQLSSELAKSGFRVNELKLERTIYKSRTDLLLIDCIKEFASEE